MRRLPAPCFAPDGLAATAEGREHWTKATQDNTDPFRFVVSTADEDRMGDVIEQSGWRLSSFRKNPIALWQHDARSPIGTWEDVRIEDGALTARLKLAAHNTSPFINTVRSLLEQRILRACSVGFRAIKVEPIKDSERGGLRFKEQELLEISVVSVPANQHALTLAKSLGASADDVTRLFASPDLQAVHAPKVIARSGIPPTTAIAPDGAKDTPMNGPFSQRINALDAEIASLNDELMVATNNLDAAPDDAAIQEKHKSLMAAIDTKSATVASLRDANARLAIKVQQRAADAGQLAAPAAIASHPTHKSTTPGDLLFKMAAASFLSFAQRKPLPEVLEERYSNTPAVKGAMEWVQRTAVGPATTTGPGWAAELVQNDVRGFLDTMREVSVGAALASRSIMLDFGGYNSITVPRRNPLGTTLSEPAWVGEAGVIPLTQFSFGSTVISRYKLAAIVVLSKEVAERTTPAIEGLLRSAITEAYAQVLDAALLSNLPAVTGVRPAGLLNGVAPIAGTVGGGDAAVRADLKAMISAMLAARTGARPVLLLNTTDRLSVSLMTTPLGEEAFSEQLAAGRLLGMDVVSSGHVPQGSAIIVDAAALATAFDTPMFDVSDVATITEANADTTAPTQAMTAGGTVGTAGQVLPDSGIRVAQQAAAPAAAANYTARSLWQTYSLGVRMVAPTSWAVLRPGSVQVVNNLSW